MKTAQSPRGLKWSPAGNEPMRRFLINRARILGNEMRQFSKTRRIAENWICQALRFAKRVGDEDLYQQILQAGLSYRQKT